MFKLFAMFACTVVAFGMALWATPAAAKTAFHLGSIGISWAVIVALLALYFSSKLKMSK